MSKFHLPSSTATTSAQSSPSVSAARRFSTSSYHFSDDDDNDDLPFPTPLPRSDFLAPNFEPSAYLSNLGHRHQTLEDLRGELRSRSTQLGQELVELVNSQYEQFLGLGGSVSGGSERAEELRVGLLSLRREVEAVRAVVEEKETEVEGLLRQRKDVRREVERGRRMLEWEGRVARLEEKLGVVEKTQGVVARIQQDEEDVSSEDDDEEDEAEEEGDVGAAAVSLGRLRREVEELRTVQGMGSLIGSTHPFVAAQAHRVMKLRNTLLLDLGTALKQAHHLDKGVRDRRTLKVLDMFHELGAVKDAIEVIKRLPRR